jgi:hypothetical protein
MGDTTAALDRSTNDVDQLAAELFELDIRTLPISMACTNNTDNGCSASCPSRGCSATCACE